MANSSWSTTATINLYSPGSLMLSPASANLMAGATQQFTPTLTNGIAADVTWSLNSSSAGSISATGLYTAPPAVAALQTITVTATTADLRTATATIHLVPTSTVAVTPAAATLGPNQQQQFTASVSGVWNNAVNWSVSPTGTGSITQAGVYKAPSTIAANTTVTIMAASVANPGTAGYATIAPSPAAPSVTVAVTPPAVSLTTGQMQQFAATVSGAANSAVTWSIIPSVGSIGASGLYTAPAIAGAPRTITVQAASVAYPANFATATISLTPLATNSYSYRRPRRHRPYQGSEHGPGQLPGSDLRHLQLPGKRRQRRQSTKRQRLRHRLQVRLRRPAETEPRNRVLRSRHRRRRHVDPHSQRVPHRRHRLLHVVRQ